jgi:tRNA nucleotidyltransferase (CCA-adding enzyme)
VQTMDGFDVRWAVLGITAHHLKPGSFMKATPPASDGAFRRLAQKVDMELLARVAESDCEGRGGGFDCSSMGRFLERARSLGVENRPPAPIVLGRHLLELGMTPGPEVGAILKQIYERQLDGEVTSLEEGIALARNLREGQTRVRPL